MNTTTGGDAQWDEAAIRDSLARAMASGGTIADLQGIGDDECEALYTLGYGLYEKGRYADALKVLAYLVALNPREYRYVMALGGAAQALGNHRDALQQYMAATLLEPLEPLAALHSAECLLELGHAREAVQSCDLAIEMCRHDGQGRHGIVLERAQTLRAAAQTRITEGKRS